MVSDYKVLWTDQAIKNLQSILKFLEEEWTASVIKNFKTNLSKSINLLRKFPFIGAESLSKEGLRQLIIDKNVSIIYEVESYLIIIHYLYDNRQDPKNIKSH